MGSRLGLPWLIHLGLLYLMPLQLLWSLLLQVLCLILLPDTALGKFAAAALFGCLGGLGGL